MIDIFLDRDGVLIYDNHYLKNVDHVSPIIKTLLFLSSLNSMGTRYHVVSNQSGVGRGLISLPEHQAIDSKFRDLMKLYGMELSTIEYCLHSPIDECECRKPKTLLLERISEMWGIDKKKCLFIGDKESDYQTGINFGCRAYLVSSNTFVPSEWLNVSSMIYQMWSSS